MRIRNPEFGTMENGLLPKESMPGSYLPDDVAMPMAEQQTGNTTPPKVMSAKDFDKFIEDQITAVSKHYSLMFLP